MTGSFAAFRYMSFDVVGTLIDFERGLLDALRAIASGHGAALDEARALDLYRAARGAPDVGRFPDDLVRCYLRIAPALGLPAEAAPAERLRASVADWRPFPDSVAALAELGERFRLVAMTNAQRWAFEHFDNALGRPFHASFTPDETGTEKPDPAFFRQVLAHVAAEGGRPDALLHVAQSQYHDIGVSRALGLSNCWIQRRSGKPGYGGTIAPEADTVPDFHFTSMAGLAGAVAAEKPEEAQPV
ncbi:HAD-IA family hydrolase [Paralimibaculum aggregatum]|uniref:HAD-IA family hydrolase n=1 Tax=Paralimibaculum aggregatum TaxID=3036245 RepID=A0ABQ6LID0_9RHOB|nr:HAD-IA family hydrolase [Limibaculum sp. NKW23]GMG83043.1 HAD-IA family hydrolase [Limibaculum sp. NKW23]